MTTHTIEKQRQSQDAFARKLVARLSDTTHELPHDISERLKVARTLAMAKRNVMRPVLAADPIVAGNTLVMRGGPDFLGFWAWLSSGLPLVALVAGLIGIGVLQDDMRASEIAAVDAELLTDELPPAAYTDPGFVQFLRAQQAEH